MTELEIKVKGGKIYFPKALNKVYPDNQKLVAWFCKGKYSNLLSKLGLSHEEIDTLAGKSNQFIILEEHDNFLSFLQKDVKALADENEHPSLTYAKYLRGICRYCDDYVVGSKNPVVAPKVFTNFQVDGDYILISYNHNNNVCCEVWKQEIWETIKQHLIQENKLSVNPEQKPKRVKKKKTDKEIIDELEKNGL